MLHVVMTGCRYQQLVPEHQILAPIATVTAIPPGTQDEIIPAVAHADAIVNHLCTINAQIIASLECCQVIVISGVGVDSVDVDAATSRGIQVCNVPDYCSEEVATHTLALLLALERRIPHMMARLQIGHWDAPTRYVIRRLTGRTLGLLGFGRIARRVAALARAFDLRILTHDPFVSPEEARTAAAEWVPLDALLARSDYLSIHAPLTRDTMGPFGSAELSAMRPGAILINTSRGKIVQERALAAAIQSGRLRGAALDVFNDEPLPPSSPLLQIENVIVTPHMAWYSEESQTEVRRRAAEEVRRVLTGAQPHHPVNRVETSGGRSR